MMVLTLILAPMHAGTTEDEMRYIALFTTFTLAMAGTVATQTTAIAQSDTQQQPQAQGSENTQQSTAGTEDVSLCARMIDSLSARMDRFAQPQQAEGQATLDEAHLEGARLALDGARRVAGKDVGACLTMVNAARTVLASGRIEGNVDDLNIVDLRTWQIAPLYSDTWSASALIDDTAYGVDGEEVGEVHDILVTPRGDVAAIIVEGGGILDIGDRHVRVEWSDVEMIETDEGGVKVPLNADNMTDWDLFREGDMAGPRDDEELVRMTSMLNDTVRSRNGALFGYADDFLLKDGKIQSMVVRPAVGYGTPPRSTYATPYHAYNYGFSPGYDFYLMPYDSEQVLGMEAFDTTKVSGPGAATEKTAGNK